LFFYSSAYESLFIKFLSSVKILKETEIKWKKSSFSKILNQYNVKYLLIGRQACILYGLPLYTFDYDIAIDNSEENLEKIFKIAKELELYPTKSESKIKAKKIPIFSLQNDTKIDIFCARRYAIKPNKFITFKEIFDRKIKIKDEKLKIEFYLPSIDDLILLKQINPRQKDLEDIKALKILERKEDNKT
jgi:hypothetical protein